MNARVAAHRILRETRGGEFADRVAERVLPDVAPADRGLALEIAYGCLRLRARIDRWIETYTDRPLARIDADVLDWIRIGVYELKELRTPDHAAVSEAVGGARRAMDTGRAGFVNAVLRAIVRDGKPDPFPSRDTDPLGYLASWGSHPEWLLRRWLDRWSAHDVFRLVQADNAPPPVVLRRLGPGAEEPGNQGLEPLDAWPRSARLLAGSPAEALRRVRGVIQDPAASAVVDYAGAPVESPVYDACAAPGTKTALLADAAGGPVLAGDVSRERLARVRAAARRLGLPIACAVADARTPPVAGARTVLADVPCSGTAVLRRRPDARWRIGPADLAALVDVQGEILTGCARTVADGGLLVYSTCSLEPEENVDQVERFLDAHPGFAREPNPDAPVPAACLTAEGDLFVRPWLTGTDGAYAARLRRVR